MNAFLSYSVHPDDQYIVSLLAKKLAETGLNLVTSYNQSESMEFQTANEIRNSALFIGLITKSGWSYRSSKVFGELNHAVVSARPTILLIEEGVILAQQIVAQNVVWFNRFNIEQSVQQVRNQISHTPHPQKNPDGTAWLIGGIAVLALLAYLSNDKK